MYIILASNKSMEPGMRAALQEQLHQLASVAATQWVTTKLGHVAGAAFTSAVNNATDQTLMSVFASQLEVAQVAFKADEAQKEANRLAAVNWGSWIPAPFPPGKGGWASPGVKGLSSGHSPGRAEARARTRAVRAGKGGQVAPATAQVRRRLQCTVTRVRSQAISRM